MNGLDLSLFQFDFDQTFAVLFFNADGTVYGRYGTRAGSGPNSTTHVSLPSLKRTMERVLWLHQGYPANRARVAAKRGPKPEHATPNAIPALRDRPARITTREHGCIHCHQVRDSALRERWEGRKLQPSDLWVHPLPENVGLKMLVDDGLRVERVLVGSPAAAAGLAAGDELTTLAGQSLTSQADIQWALNGLPDTGEAEVEFLRAGTSRRAALRLSGDWKKTDLAWRASSGPGLRYGLWTAPLTPDQKRARGLQDEPFALEVKNLFAPRADPVRRAGVRPGDVIVGADGRRDFAHEGDFLAYLRLAHPPGDRVRLTLVRQGQRQEIDVPLW